ncbi:MULTISPECIES: TraQ conjugal transfer family protein [Flavobacteriaceae]|uniref:TraQ conjugal transfer family protein n=1 Tax=Flavobacteriaceae TaxID=49546 RepID=UPI001492FAF7|nr:MULTISPECIES: TraQ conjugal transfer family protein [Allomuricauda]MDC6367208.1 TraQ conjugal transfer family protein [Muricauda sp. AC10]
MKSINLLSSILFALVLFVSCSKESEVVSSFSFSLSETHAETTTVNLFNETLIRVIPEKVVSSVVYEVKYEVESGSGKFYDADGNPIPKSSYLPISALETSMSYSSSVIGEESVRVYVRDSEGKEENILLVYNFVHNDFTVEFSAPFSVAKVKDRVPLTISLFNNGVDDNVSFERAIFITQGSADMYLPGSDQKVALDTYEEVQPGTFSFEASFADLGEATIKVSVKDSNNQIVEKTLNFTIEEIDVSFSATSDKNEVAFGDANDIFFTVSENGGSGGQYQLKYEMVEGDIDLFFNNQPINPGVFYDVLPGAFTWEALANYENDVEIVFTLKNQFGAELTNNVTFSVIKNELSIETVPLAFQTVVDNKIEMTTTISESPTTSFPYILSFSSNGGGTIEYAGVSYEEGVPFTIAQQEFSLFYNPLSAGNHEVTFTLQNQQGTIAEDSQIFNVGLPGFSVNLDVPANVTPGGGSTNSMGFSLEIIPDTEGQVFEMMQVDFDEQIQAYTVKVPDQLLFTFTYYVENEYGPLESLVTSGSITDGFYIENDTDGFFLTLFIKNQYGHVVEVPVSVPYVN